MCRVGNDRQAFSARRRPSQFAWRLEAALDAALQGRDLVRNLLLLTQNDDPSQPPTPADPQEVASHVAPAADTQVILLVDDEPLVRRTVRRLLEREGYKVLEASNAQEARQVLRDGSVDLVILDQSMPGEAGILAFPSLRALTPAPIVLFTGMVPSVPEGFAGILQKPARPEELRRMVTAALARQS